MNNKAILSNRLYVPSHLVTDEITKQFTYEIKDLRDPNTVITYKTFKQFENGYHGFHRGNMGKINAVFADFEIEDQRAIVPFEYDLRLKEDFELTEDQQRIWEEYLDYEYGTIEAPARWGKTVLMTYMLVAFKQVSLVLADEWVLLDQFEKTVRDLTNINDLEKQHGIKLIGAPKKYGQVFPICTINSYHVHKQEEAKEALKSIRDSFGAVFIDESHLAAAREFSKVITNFNSWYRIPVTATPERKDGLHIVSWDAVGPPIVKGIVEGLDLLVEIIWTQHRVKEFHNWNTFVSRLCKDQKRNRLIVEKVMEDIRNGHYVLITTEKPTHGASLKTMFKELYPDVTVATVFGTLNREEKIKIKERVDAGEFLVTIAQNRIAQKGWNVWRWSALHNAVVLANRHNWYQRICRPRTKCPNCPGVNDEACGTSICMKKKPVARVYADLGHPAVYGCLNTMGKVHKEHNLKVINGEGNDTYGKSNREKLNLNG